MPRQPAGRFALHPIAIILAVGVLAVALWWVFSRYWSRTESEALVIVTSPANGAFGNSTSTTVQTTFRNRMRADTISSSTFVLRNSSGHIVPATVTYQASAQSATLKTNAPLAYSAIYTATLTGGPSGVRSRYGKSLTSDLSWKFTTGAEPSLKPADGPGGPILILTGTTNPFSSYYAEILRTEGLNEFAVSDILLATAATLRKYDIVILGEFPLDRQQVTVLM